MAYDPAGQGAATVGPGSGISMGHGRKPSARFVRVLVVASVLPVATTFVASASAADPHYRIVSTPESLQTGLYAVSCPTPTHCVAVGQSFKTGALIESRDGTSWSLAPVADAGTASGLDGVACPTANFCVAVGAKDSGVLIETWRGSAWTIEPAPTPADSSASLDSVSCVSRSRCIAVGGFAATSSPYKSRPLAESWDGTHWTLMAPRRPSHRAAFLDGVSCPNATDCVAVGNRETAKPGADDAAALIEQLHGTTWSIDTAPDSGLNQTFLSGVSCVDTATCVAVGWGEPNRAVAMKWDGAVWSVTTTATPHDRDLLDGVSCASATHCVATGYRADSGATFTHVESFDGVAWTSVPSDSAPGANDNYLSGASCPRTGRCFVVGFYRGVGLGQQALVLAGR
jgi:hypothetical protein